MTQHLLTNEQFVFALEASPTGMVLTDAAGKVLKVNQHIERIFGFARNELEGQSVERIVPLDLRGSYAALRGLRARSASRAR
jgi:PAS domain S-box-containing protein